MTKVVFSVCVVAKGNGHVDNFAVNWSCGIFIFIYVLIHVLTLLLSNFQVTS